MHFDAYLAVALGLGALALLVAWLPVVLERRPLSLPILCVIAGAAVFASSGISFDPRALGGPAMLRETEIAEHSVGAIVLIALMGVGLKIDRPFSVRRWATTWRLLGIAMPLSIAGIALLARYEARLPLPEALLLGAALAPTDPVLAGDVELGPPGVGEEGEVRFGLTSEAGLNDGLALPFLYVALEAAHHTAPRAGWIAADFIGNPLLSLALGAIMGRLFGWLQFRRPRGGRSGAGDGLAALGTTFLTYGVTQTAGGYGFLAVFACAVSMRAVCRDSRVHFEMAEFVGQIERLLAMLLMVLFGGALVAGLLERLNAAGVVVGLGLLLVIRPLSAWIGLLGSPHPPVSRAATSFFGIRGIGTLYYLLFAFNHAPFAERGRVWAIAGFVIACSVFVHGLTSTPVMRRLDAIRAGTPRPRSRELSGDSRRR